MHLIPFKILEPRTAGEPANELVIAAAQLVLNVHGYARGKIRVHRSGSFFNPVEYFVEVKDEDRNPDPVVRKRKGRR